MLGLMQDWPLLVHKIIDHAALYHGDREVVTRTVEGPITRTNYRTIAGRARRVAKALVKAGIKSGDRVGTLAWNSARHIEAWYGIAGMGGVYHTLNPRLHADQIAWIMNHAEDRALFFDTTFTPIVEQIVPMLKKVKLFVAMTDRANLPKAKIPKLIAYEDFIAKADDKYEWKEFDERSACGLCYTSGTTGNPKGVLYSHRSNVLHAFMAGQSDAQGIKNTDVILPIVPMFDANAWALAFAAPMTGSKLVMPGPKLDGPSVCELLAAAEVTMIGGSACPRSMIEIFETKYDVEVVHAWGMTEMSPLGSLGTLKHKLADLPYAQKLDYKMKQGHPPFGVEMKITDDKNKELLRDGKAFGRLKVRGPAVAKGYFKGEGKSSFD